MDLLTKEKSRQQRKGRVISGYITKIYIIIRIIKINLEKTGSGPMNG
jgi:hypothetical protein